MEFWNAVYLGISITFGVLVALAYTAAKVYASYRSYVLLQAIHDDTQFIKNGIVDFAKHAAAVNNQVAGMVPEVAPDVEVTPQLPHDLYAFLVKEYAKQGYPPALAEEMATEAVNQELNSTRMVTE